MRIIATLLLVACGSAAGPDLHQQSVAVGTGAVASERPRFAVEWMDLITQRVLDDKLSPPQAARIYGYAGVTLHEVTRFSAPTPLASLATQLNGLGALPEPRADVTYDWNVALASAMGELVELVFYSDQSRSAAQDLRARQIAARHGDGVTELCADASIVFGAKIAKAVFDWSETDGFKETRDDTWVAAAVEGHWEPTGTVSEPVEPFWGTLRTFALGATENCRAVRPSKFSTHTDSAFYQEATLTMRTRHEATDEQRASVSRWSRESADWITIASERLTADDSRLSRAGKTYALIGLAIADGNIVAWQEKYRYNLLRPVTYIQRYLDGSWAPLVETPAFPEYVSSQALVAAAAAEIMTTLYGDGAIKYAQHAYPSYWDAALEAADAGVVAGVQFPMSADAGVNAGYCVAHGVLDRLRL